MKAILSAALVALSVLAGASLSASAADDKCPAGYELIGKLCQDSNSGDIVFPN